METDLNKLRDRAYKISKAHGFHEKELSDETYLMLIITDIAEAVNADRKNHHSEIEKFDEWQKGWNKEIKEQPYSDNYTKSNFKDHFDFYIEGSVECELADVAIRLLDFAGAKNTDLGVMKHTRDYDTFRGKKSFSESCFILVAMVVYRYMHQFRNSIDTFLRDIIRTVFGLAESYGINLGKFIDLKMKYNELRPYKNGKNY